MFLQQDHAGAFCEAGDVGKLALPAAVLPIVAADDGIHHLLAVEPMLDAAVYTDDPALIELACGS